MTCNSSFEVRKRGERNLECDDAIFGPCAKRFALRLLVDSARYTQAKGYREFNTVSILTVIISTQDGCVAWRPLLAVGAFLAGALPRGLRGEAAFVDDFLGVDTMCETESIVMTMCTRRNGG